MVMLKARIILITFCVFLLGLPFSPSLYSESKDKKILVHYMPWYATKPVSGYWGWHWTMNQFNPEKVKENGQRDAASHDYPLIGLYDSNDSDALECQVLLMKLAGIDGVIIDWYGIKKFRDYAEIHRNSLHLIKHLRRAGLEYAICYEDQTIKHMIKGQVIKEEEDIDHGKDVMEWLSKNWFSDDAYVKMGGQPILLVFGPQYFAKDQWKKIVSGIPNQPKLFALPHLTKQVGVEQAFGWPPVSGGRKITPSVWRKYLNSLYSRPNPENSVISLVFPGFKDIYKQAKLHDSYGSIDARNGKTFKETFELALKSKSEIIQIATWNDYGEGTVIEPTKEHGYRYLEHIQKHTKALDRYSQDDLQLPVMLYQLKKRKVRNPEQIKRTQRAAELLFNGKNKEAREIIHRELPKK